MRITNQLLILTMMLLLLASCTEEKATLQQRYLDTDNKKVYTFPVGTEPAQQYIYSPSATSTDPNLGFQTPVVVTRNPLGSIQSVCLANNQTICLDLTDIIQGDSIVLDQSPQSDLHTKWHVMTWNPANDLNTFDYSLGNLSNPSDPTSNDTINYDLALTDSLYFFLQAALASTNLFDQVTIHWNFDPILSINNSNVELLPNPYELLSPEINTYIPPSANGIILPQSIPYSIPYSIVLVPHSHNPTQ